MSTMFASHHNTSLGRPSVALACHLVSKCTTFTPASTQPELVRMLELLWQAPQFPHAPQLPQCL